MASRDHKPAYLKYYGERSTVLTEKSTDDDVRRVYDEWAGEYDKDLNSAGYACPKPMVEFLDNTINEVFEGKIAKSDIRIMDAGAGTGLVGVELHKYDYSNVDALDISQEMLNEAKKTNVYSKFICAPLSDQQIPGVETDAYDALISVGTLIIAHVRPTAFLEMIRVVRNGGLVCVSIREDGYKDYNEKMAELEHQGKWTLVKEGTIPLYDKEDMPRECSAFAFKVNKN